MVSEPDGGRLAKSLIPVSFLAIIAFQRIGRQWTMPPFSTARLVLLGSDVSSLLITASWLLFGWALIDYLVEWRSRESRLKMSREDMREEFKETEGNPQIRSRIRGLQRQMRRRKVKADVSKAAVVLTNPTISPSHWDSTLWPWMRPGYWPKGATYWRRRSKRRLAGQGFRSLRTLL